MIQCAQNKALRIICFSLWMKTSEPLYLYKIYNLHITLYNLYIKVITFGYNQLQIKSLKNNYRSKQLFVCL